MIQRMSYASIVVLDQDEARDFYVDKLGFQVKTDEKLPIMDFGGLPSVLRAKRISRSS